MMSAPDKDTITPEQAGSLFGLFQERVRRTPETTAYRFYDALNGVWTDATWKDMHRDIKRWQNALSQEKLSPGDRVAIMARNSRFWVMFDMAALSLGLVVVPLYTEDRADNVRYVLENSQVKLLLIGGQEQWDCLNNSLDGLTYLKRIVSIAELENQPRKDKRFSSLSSWLPHQAEEIKLPDIDIDALATIVYTSGTTGRPKGVMLSHKNILTNAFSGLQTMPITPNEVFLSFLPLSHTLERTVGYYLPMMAGCVVAHARSIPELAKDLLVVRPTGLISVPRIYERVYARIKDNLSSKPASQRYMFELAVKVGWRKFEYEQGRASWHPSLMLWPLLKRLVADKISERLGGRLKAAISGGAALSPEVAKVFVGLGLPILQGYGLTESSPVISVNRLESNIPASIGLVVPGVEVKIGENDELLAKGDNIMLGFWDNPEETARVIDQEGWLHTGDKARIEDGYIYITGRIKDIIVMANGEKVSPVDMELAIMNDPLFEQVLLIGEAQPFLSALVVLNKMQWQKFTKENSLPTNELNSEQVEKALLSRIGLNVHEFPGYAQIYKVHSSLEPWTVEAGLLTPTLKTKRPQIKERFTKEIEDMYKEHKI